MPIPTNLENIRRNIFREAHPAIVDWAKFPWHPSKAEGVSDSDLLHSSQAFCISVWGTFAARTGRAVRSAVVELVDDDAFGSAVGAVGVGIDLRLEDIDRDRLNEHPRQLGTPTNLDALICLPNLKVAVESKLTENFGICSQAKAKKCSGVYGRGSDLKAKSDASCRLELPDGLRQRRLYWDVMRRISNENAYPTGEACAFAGSAYQIMRVIASAAQLGSSDWRALFAYPGSRGTTRAEIVEVVQRLRPEHRRRILHLDYVALAQRLAQSSDGVAQELGLHLRERLKACRFDPAN